MTKATGTSTTRGAVEELRSAATAMLGAERRLRSRDHVRPGELTVAQIRTLAALGSDRELTAGQLARSADLTPASVTGILDQLEAGGIVQRRRSTEDRRVCHVSLTDEGERLLERRLAAWQALWEERLSGFGDDELATASRVLRELTGVFNAAAARLEGQ